MFNRFKVNGPLKDSADGATSDAIYLRGGWDRLGQGDDMARFFVIAGYCATRGAASILDMGCGDGLLASRLLEFDNYVGVDLSAVAVGRAESRHIPNTTFVAAEAQNYAPDGTFDAIVFNEMLYYVEGPEKVALRLTENLNPGGAAIVSIHHSPRHQWVWRRLAKHFETVDGFCVQHAKGSAWDVRVIQPMAH
jgi:2-polyprenyl-3-methyl-5-hydroxy-6-metoxy-1,4-benzoquinol methylase